MADRRKADAEDGAEDVWGDGDTREDSRDDSEAIADFIKNEWWQRELDAYCAAVQAAAEAPLIEACRPVMRAAFDDFLNDRERWADDILKAAEGGFRLDRLFDGNEFARDRADAVLKLGWVMAFYHPQDNPLSEAQGKRARELGLFERRDENNRATTDDEIVLGLGYLLLDLRSEDPWPSSPGVVFPKHVGDEGAMTELKRWFRLVVGREFEDSDRTDTGNDDVTHSTDFRSLQWFGESYTFSPTQAACVKVLLEARHDGTPTMGQLEILDRAGSSGDRLRDVFRQSGKMHPAWGTLIVPADGKGLYRLAEPSESTTR